MKTPTFAIVPFLLSIANAYTGDMTYYEAGKPIARKSVFLIQLTHIL